MKGSTLFFALLSGGLFGAGLAVSTMIQPEVVLSFLTLVDLGLLLVLGGAMAVTLVAYRFAPKLMRRPVAAPAFGAHPASMSRDTVVGAALFGVGWGLSGVCPAPAIAGLGAQNWALGYAVVGLLLGAWLHGRLFGKG
jgi:uncharacterized membrane protein YedE/YeeE